MSHISHINRMNRIRHTSRMSYVSYVSRTGCGSRSGSGRSTRGPRHSATARSVAP